MNNKPFDTVSIVLLVMVAGLSDAVNAVVILIAAVPAIGQVAYLGNMFLVSPLVWATIQLWFIMKVGFGSHGLVNVAGGILNVIGIPGGQTGTVIVAIYLANNPKALATIKLAGAAQAGLRAAKSAEKGAKIKAFRKEFGEARAEGMLPQRQGLEGYQTAATMRYNRELRGEAEPQENEIY